MLSEYSERRVPRHASSLLHGKDAVLNTEIITTITMSGPQTIYDLCSRINERRRKLGVPSAKEHDVGGVKYSLASEVNYSVVNRRVHKLADQQYLEVVEERLAQKQKQLIKVYGLSFKASLLAMLIKPNVDLIDFEKNCRGKHGNPLLSLTSKLRESGVPAEVINTWIIETVRIAVKNGFLNVDMVNINSGSGVVYLPLMRAVYSRRVSKLLANPDTASKFVRGLLKARREIQELTVRAFQPLLQMLVYGMQGLIEFSQVEAGKKTMTEEVTNLVPDLVLFRVRDIFIDPLRVLTDTHCYAESLLLITSASFRSCSLSQAARVIRNIPKEQTPLEIINYRDEVLGLLKLDEDSWNAQVPSSVKQGHEIDQKLTTKEVEELVRRFYELSGTQHKLDFHDHKTLNELVSG